MSTASPPLSLSNPRAELARIDPKKVERKQQARLAEEKATRQQFNRFRAQLACNEIQPNDIRKLYDVRNVIGEGGFGKVRLAIHRLTGCTVAIKSYKRSEFDRNPYGVGNTKLEQRKYARKQAKIEYECMRRLNHFNIVDVYQLIETPNGSHIVMQVRILWKQIYSNIVPNACSMRQEEVWRRY